MALPTFPSVQPGGVIHASLMKLVLQALSDLDTRLSKVEAAPVTAGKPHISDYSPRTTLHEGDTLTISGENLSGGGANSVVFDRGTGTPTPVTTFATRTESLLVFGIPGVFAQAGGSSVSLRVTSATQGADSVALTVFPAPITVPTGDVRVQLSSPQGTTFAPGTAPKLGYTLNANTTLADTYDLVPKIDGAGWSVAIVDGANPPNVISNPTVLIEAAASANQPVIKKGYLQVTIAGTGAAASANLQLEVKSRLNPTGLDRFSSKAVLPLNGTVLLSDGIGIVPTPSATDVDSAGNLLVPVGTTGLTIIFLVTVTTAGSYAVTPRFDNDQDKWTANLISPIPFPSPNVPRPVSVVVKASSGPSSSNLYLKVTAPNGVDITEVFYPVKTK